MVVCHIIHLLIWYGCTGSGWWRDWCEDVLTRCETNTGVHANFLLTLFWNIFCVCGSCNNSSLSGHWAHQFLPPTHSSTKRTAENCAHERLHAWIDIYQFQPQQNFTSAQQNLKTTIKQKWSSFCFKEAYCIQVKRLTALSFLKKFNCGSISL